MSLTILNADEQTELEHRAASRFGEDALMRRAGDAAATWILDHFEETTPAVTILCGPGNNGGDGLHCALKLKEAGADVVVVLPGDRTPSSPLAKSALEAYKAQGGEVASDPYLTRKADCVVDALFGTGLNKPIKGDDLDAVLWFNERHALKVALDIPSGLNAATGQWVGSIPGCRADVTITFLSVKAGFYMKEGVDAVGDIVLNELDVSVPLTRLSVIGKDEFPYVQNPRARNCHKGDFGHVAVIGGDTGMVGAAILAARSALILGAGRVTVEALAENAPSWDPTFPELMFAQHVDLDTVDVVVMGPGLGKSEGAKARLVEVLALKKPVVLDADALNLISDDMKLQDQLLARVDATVITPHPGEAARLLRRSVADVEVDRVAASRELAVQSGAMVVLKGAGTVISLKSARSWINPTGSAALATAGSGDVLAGMIGAFFAQRFDMGEAVLAAVYYHGAAAEGFLAGFTAGAIAHNAAYLLAQDRGQ